MGAELGLPDGHSGAVVVTQIETAGGDARSDGKRIATSMRDTDLISTLKRSDRFWSILTHPGARKGCRIPL